MADYLVIQRQVDLSSMPDDHDFKQWVDISTEGNEKKEIVIRVVDEAEITQLNQQFRNKAASTNVLSFPASDFAQLPAAFQPEQAMLGDIAICAAVVEKEAIEQGKSLQAHWAHMVIHSVLHLQGYDHISASEAEEMESLEIKLLAELGYANPYILTS